jgi:hypothetical protein
MRAHRRRFDGATAEAQEFFGTKDIEVWFNHQTGRYEDWQNLRTNRLTDRRVWRPAATYDHWGRDVLYGMQRSFRQSADELIEWYAERDAEIERDFNRRIEDIAYEYSKDEWAHVLGHRQIISTPV